MNLLRTSVCIALGFTLGCFAATPDHVRADDAPAVAAWRREIDAIIDDPEFRRAHWGVLAIDLADGRTLYERDAEKMFAPASVTKLFSVAAALDALGADHRFVTPVYARGDVDDDGRLDGDLILVAAGDPTLGGRTDEEGRIAFRNVDHTYAGFSSSAELTPFDPTAGLKALAKQIAAAGIKEVDGDVLVDDRLFVHAEGSGSGPKRLTPIVVNDNVLDFTIAPADEEGAAATIDWRPRTAAFTIDAAIETAGEDGPTRIVINEPVSGQILLRGTIAKSRKPVVLFHEVDRPASFARSLFIEALRSAGVQTAASPLGENVADRLPPTDGYAAMKPIAEFTSPPFAESAKLTLKVSQNLHAGLMPLLVAAKHGKRTLSDGLRLEGEFLRRVGVDADGTSFGGGAGGDRADYVTPRATVQLLTAMTKHDDFATYRDALPLLGVDGTLATAVAEDSPARGKVRAKTGTLVWGDLANHRTLLQSKALAGYVDAADGRTIVFACFVNLAPLTTAGDRERIGRVLGTIAERLHAAP
jgi:D-alanyl-D-alanine carboxypeptidase/D-alanyl-D-alanine-endopeptidase (penicillin-binding protein 4)